MKTAVPRQPAAAPNPVPPILFPEELPVSARRQEIADAVRAHQVVIVCGETGSGKTTQLPKICLSIGRGIGAGGAGLIGHTQPRRLAATSTAKRIAQELGTPPGEHVGYKIRFNDALSAGASVKLMTDGILLAEISSDPLLRAYDTLIIDEAHERSLNIDFLLGYLKQLLPRRPDLKLIITSATIDAERFARHFGVGEGAACKPVPVIEVSGRLYPVEVRYRPIIDDKPKAPGKENAAPAKPADRRREERDLYDGIVDAVDELAREGPGDVLVFLPGEREIREAAEALRKHHPAHTEILPLFARLSVQDQERIFRPSNARRIVLATNVAETSLTVPGIRYVVDTGMARVKRYSYRNKVEQLQIEAVSQSSANQRAGRCGRVADGICIRLYDETDFINRAKFGDPEILRSSLAAVILRMKSLRLGDIENFPFLEPPLGRAIADGYHLLQELGALDDDNRLTDIGRQLARLPLDPRVGRMLLAARDNGCLREMLVIASALSVQDPRERPADQQAAADAAHRQFADDKSEFLSWLKLWKWFGDAVAHKKTNRQLQDQCRSQFLNHVRLREWRDVHAQLHTTVAEIGGREWRLNESDATYDQLHQALLTGLLGNLGCKSDDEAWYLGARGIKFHLWPGSHLAKKAGRWVMAAELVETSRLYARTLARIEPEWVEKIGGHLLRKSWSDPHWEKKAAQVMAYERGTLYGLTIYQRRRVNFARMNPREAREIFIRRALVEGEFETRLPFFAHNRKLVREIENLEHKSRRQDVLVDEELIFAFYDQQLPAEVCSGATLERWYNEAAKAGRGAAGAEGAGKSEVGKSEGRRGEGGDRLLYLNRDDLMRHEAAGITTDLYPKTLPMAGIDMQLSYHFEPGSPRDGVTLTVPLHALNQVSAARADWLVPGMLKEKVHLLLKSLPQKLRRHMVPLPEYAAGFCERSAAQRGMRTVTDDLLDSLIADIRAQKQVVVKRGDFKPETLPAHHSMNFKVIDEHGRQLDMGRNLAQLRAELGAQAQREFQQAFQKTLGSRAGAGGAGSSAAEGGDGVAGQGRRAGAAAPAGRAVNGAAGGGVFAAAGQGPSARAAGAGAHGQEARREPAAPGMPGAQPGAEAGLGAGQDADEQYTNLTTWSFGELPELLEVRGRGKDRGKVFFGYPALVDCGAHCDVEVFDDPEEAREMHRAGLRRLFALQLREPLKYLEKNIPNLSQMAMQYMSLGTLEELRAQVLDVALDRACLQAPLPQNQAEFMARKDEGRARLNLLAQEIARLAGAILAEYAGLGKKLVQAKGHAQAHADLDAQLKRLMDKRFLIDTPYAQLAHYPRYLKGIALRIDKLKADSARDAQRMVEMAPLLQGWQRAEKQLRSQGRGMTDPKLEEFRWLLEELRISLFAQELRTPMPVSVKRLHKVWESLQR